MLYRFLAVFALTLGLSAAVPHEFPAPQRTGLVPRQAVTSPTNLLVSGVGQIRHFKYDGSFFIPSANGDVLEPGKLASYMIFKEPNFLYAIDSYSSAIRLFHYDPPTATLSQEIASWKGQTNIVHLAFDASKTKLLASSYEAQVDVWDASSADGHLSLDKQIVLPAGGGIIKNSQPHPGAQSAVLDPSGRYFVVNDYAADALHIIDTQKNYTDVRRIPVTPSGSGPGYGAFISINNTGFASHYIVSCMRSMTVQLFACEYNDKTMELIGIHTTPSHAPGLGPAIPKTAGPGQVLVSQTAGPVSIYVANMFTGNETDNIARFALEAKSATDPTAQLIIKGQITSGGIAPHMFMLGSDPKRERLFVANMNGENGLVAFHRDEMTGQLNMTLAPRLKNTAFNSQAIDPGWGPQFVLGI